MSETNYKSNWTVMVYFAADNDLDDVAFENLRQMKQVGSNSKFNILAQLDTRGIGKTVRFRIRDQRTTLDEDTIDIMGEVNTGEASVLTDFVEWGMTRCPAEHYMLIIWGHGDGWQAARDEHRAAARITDTVVRVSDGASISVSAKGEMRLFARQKDSAAAPAQISISPEFIAAVNELFKKGGDKHFGEFVSQLEQHGVSLNYGGRLVADSQDVLTAAELKHALKKALAAVPADRVDILAMDACLMGMAETAYEVRNSADYFVASEDAVPRNSWPYERIFGRLKAKSEMSPKEVALMVIREYLIHYRDNAKGVTLSACHLSKEARQGLKVAVNGLAKALTEKLDDDKVRLAVMTARATVQSFYLREFIDLYDFCKQLDRFCVDIDVKTKCKAVMAAIFPGEEEEAKSFSEETFVWTYGHCGYPVKDAKGVSIYFPVDRLPSKQYKKLEFAERTGWGDFLEAYINKLGLPPASLIGPLADGGPLGGSPVKDDGGCTGGNLKVTCNTDEKIPLDSLIELPGREQNSPQFEHDHGE